MDQIPLIFVTPLEEKVTLSVCDQSDRASV